MNAALSSPRVGIDALLSRLENVRRCGAGWRADCPNGHKTHGTLSLAQADDGRVLLHCFAGCGTPDVLAALSLSMADIQPERLRDDSPQGRRTAREHFKLASVAAAAGVAERELRVGKIILEDARAGRAISPEHARRLAIAIERLDDIRAVLQ